MTPGGSPGGISAAAKELARSIADRAGLDELKQTLEHIERAAETSGAPDAEVWSAVELTPAERNDLEARVKAQHPGVAEFTYHVDSALLGGMVLRVGDRYLDGSLATKLGKLRHTLVAGGGA